VTLNRVAVIATHESLAGQHSVHEYRSTPRTARPTG
jgi:hypothetical protein